MKRKPKNCPKCDGKTWVPGTRLLNDKTIRERTRKCLLCGYEFKEVEQVAPLDYAI